MAPPSSTRAKSGVWGGMVSGSHKQIPKPTPLLFGQTGNGRRLSELFILGCGAEIPISCQTDPGRGTQRSIPPPPFTPLGRVLFPRPSANFCP